MKKRVLILCTGNSARSQMAEGLLRSFGGDSVEAGIVSRLYGVTTALHMVIVDPSGTVVYNGRIDDKATTQVSDLSVAKNYVDQALTEAVAARAVSTPTSEPYGCPIHYAFGK